MRRYGKKIAILAFGSMLTPALAAAEELNASVANMRFVKPLDIDLIKQLANSHDLIVTVEENTVMGGAGAAVIEALKAMQKNNNVLCLGLPDRFIEHGVHETMLAECGLDAKGIKTAIEKQLT
jgi:1-deoxy-D-xylulose-5-phosphate synthase